MNPRALKVEYAGNYQLIVTFVNNEVRQFDLGEYLKYPVYQQLKDESFCKKAKVINGVVQWNDIIDIDPDSLYLESKPTLIPA